MEKWRFMEINWLTYAETAILRPTLMKAKTEVIIPDTFTYCSFPKPSLVLSYFNDPEKDIDLEYCRKKGIGVCRVIGSGGPIFGDTGYTFSFFHLSRNTPNVPDTVEKMFEKTLTAVAEGLSDHFNIQARFRPFNDLEVKERDGVWRKIGPSSCFYEEKAVQMGSGIQIKEPDIKLIEKVIIPPPEKFKDKEAKSVRERMTYLEKAVGSEVGLEEVRDIYLEVMARAFEVEFEKGELSDTEKNYFEDFRSEYTSQDFLMERAESRLGPIPEGVVRKQLQFKIPSGPLYRIILFMEQDRIQNILMTGAIYAGPLRPTSPIDEIEKSLKGQPVDLDVITSRIDEVLGKPGFHLAKISSRELAMKIVECARINT